MHIQLINNGEQCMFTIAKYLKMHMKNSKAYEKIIFISIHLLIHLNIQHQISIKDKLQIVTDKGN